MTYAPVLITTVIRYLHFRECIESLAKCVWAEHTDVFVAVDYPPSEKYWEGYNLIKGYLSTCGNLGFNSLNIVYRETNYFYTERGNIDSLRDEVFETYDRCIVSEDDNIFSPNFLVFINKGLEMYKDDATVLAIDGYRHFYPIKYDHNTIFRQNVNFSAWGYGCWREKWIKYVYPISQSYFRSKLSIRSILKIHRNGNAHTLCYINECYKDFVDRSDWTIGVMMALEGLDVVMPCISLVRNMGWDGTGLNCNSIEYKDLAMLHKDQEISAAGNFIIRGTGKEYYEYNHAVYVNNSFGQLNNFQFLKGILRFFRDRIRNTNK